MSMAADQRRKRLNGASIAGCSPLEKLRTKKKKFEKLQNGFHPKSHISLEWDGSHKRVVAKRGQVGISWRSLRPFIDSASGYRTILADVLTLPHEIFELKDLSEVLSYEVWQTHLSENERNFLRHFLPTGAESEQALQALFDLGNFHFGNPFLKWGASVCSGHLHPDAIMHQERSLKAEKKAYYSDLQKYHDDLIEYLQNLKKKWESCKDPEKETLQKMWRSRRDAVDGISSHANEFRHGDLDQDVTTASESSTCMGDEKACSSDNQNPVRGESQARMSQKIPVKDKSIIQSTPTETKPRKGDKLHKHNFPHNDGSRYMSYVKISKKQHELVKNMKQSGKSIQSRSLNRVLGDLDSLNIQPYEEFMEEEQRKLHEHWSSLSKRELPVAHANWKEIQLQKQSIVRSLEKDIKENFHLVLEVGEENTKSLQDPNHKTSMVIDLDVCYEEKESPKDVVQDERENAGVMMDLDVSVEERENPDDVFKVQDDDDATEAESNMHGDGESIMLSPQYNSPEQVSSLGNSNACNHADVESENIHISKSNDDPSDVSERSGNLITADAFANQDVPLPSVENVWAGDGMSHVYHDSTKSHEYTSTSGLSLTHQPVGEAPRMQLIDLESQLTDVDNRKLLLHAQPDDSSFSYPNQDRNELLQSLFKDQRILSYHNEQNPVGLNFQPPKTVFTGNGQFPGHFAEQMQPSLSLEQREQTQQNQVFVQQSMSQNFPSDGYRYLIPSQGHLASSNVQNWSTNSVPRTAPFQHQLRTEDVLSQNLFPSEQQVQSRWTGSEVNIPSQSIGSVSNGDQSLFSVLSHCNHLSTSNPYDSISSSEQFISPRNYRFMGTGTPGISNNLQQSANPLGYLGGRDAATSLMPDDIGWMNLSHQNSGLHDPLGKPYLRSWNQ